MSLEVGLVRRVVGALGLLGMMAGCAVAEETPRKLEALVEGEVWRVARGDGGPGASGYLLHTPAGLIGLDLLADDPTPDATVPVLLLDSQAPPPNAYRAQPDTPRYSGAALDVETVLELGLEKLHLIPVLGPTGERVLVVWAARGGLVLAPSLLDPAPGAEPSDHAAWRDGITILRTLGADVVLPDPGRPLEALDEGWMASVRP